MDDNDDLWNQITYLTNKKVIKEKKQKQMRNGEFETKKKIIHDGPNLKKMDDDTGDYATKKADISLCKIIQQSRTKTNMKQKEIANKLNIDVNTYNKYESGILIPDNKIRRKLEHYLKVKITGKKEEWGKEL